MNPSDGDNHRDPRLPSPGETSLPDVRGEDRGEVRQEDREEDTRQEAMPATNQDEAFSQRRSEASPSAPASHRAPAGLEPNPPATAFVRPPIPRSSDPDRSQSPAAAADAPIDDRIVAALREIYDPEIPVNIYDLGLIYNVDCDDMGVVEIDMTLTSPGCPVAQTFPGVVEAAVQNVPGVAAAEVNLVWEPPWTIDRMSEAAKLELGFF